MMECCGVIGDRAVAAHLNIRLEQTNDVDLGVA